MDGKLTTATGPAAAIRRWFAEWLDDWNRFWFTRVDPATACLMRVGIGCVLLFLYGTWGALGFEAVSAGGLIDEQALEGLRAPNERGFAFLDGWTPSVWFYVSDPGMAAWLYGLFLLSIVGFTVGFASRACNLLVLAFHLSSIHRATAFAYGVDSVLSMMLLYSLMAPIGARYSVDAWLARRRGGPSEPAPSLGANLALRCVQLHLCVIYLCSGLSKLQGETWWDGAAIWHVVMSHEIHFLDMRWLALLGDHPAMTLSLIGCAFTIAYEAGFPLLVWNRRLRPVFLASGVALHGGIAVTMGLWSFGAAMIVACASFVPPEWLAGRAADGAAVDESAGEATIPLTVVA